MLAEQYQPRQQLIASLELAVSFLDPQHATIRSQSLSDSSGKEVLTGKTDLASD
jgi:hypothetical protein